MVVIPIKFQMLVKHLIKKGIKSHLVPIRPDRKFERNSGKYRSRIKSKITKN